MAWKSGIWNALLINGVYDRKYNGDDYSNPLGQIIGNGIVRTADGTSMLVTSPVISGATYGVTIKAGWGWINGKWFNNDVDDNTSITGIAAPTQNTRRYDKLVIRRDNKVADGRTMYPYLIMGTETSEAVPTKPSIVRTNDYYDLCIAEILVTRGDSVTVTITETRGWAECGWVNGYFGDDFNSFVNSLQTTFENRMNELKGKADNWLDNTSFTQTVSYGNTVTLDSATALVSIGIDSYQHGVDTLVVYTNGEKEIEGVDYTINGDEKNVVFTQTKAAGVQIHFEVLKSVEGTENISSALTQIEAVGARVGTLETFSSKYNYECNGSTDNVAISTLVKNFLNENGTDYKTLELNVYGTLGATAAASGEGISTNAYKWFDFAPTLESPNRRVIVNFGNCTGVTIPITSATNNILFFYGTGNVEIKNISIIAQNENSGTIIQGTVGTGDVVCDNIRAWVTCYGDCVFAKRGRFDNCRMNCVSRNGNVEIFSPEGSDLVQINGGEYYAYTVSGTYSTVVYHMPETTYASTIMNGVNMPTFARSGYSQTNAVRINNGYLSMINCVTALPTTATTTATTSMIGTIPVSK